MLAWHVTESTRVDRILREGMEPGSFWATDEALTAYYRKDYEDPVVIEIETDDLDPVALGFGPDRPSIAEPITVALGRAEADIIAAWGAVPGDGTWMDSVAVVGSFVISAALPASAIRPRDYAGARPGR